MMNTQELLQDLNRRYATKEFDSTKLLDQSQLQELMEAARLSPSSYGLQPWKFIVVQNALIREQLLSHSYNQRQVVDASHLVVLCIKKDFGKEDIDRYIQDMSKKRNIPKERVT